MMIRLFIIFRTCLWIAMVIIIIIFSGWLGP